MGEPSVARRMCRQSDDIVSPNGLLIGKRRKWNGETLIDYKSRGKHDMMTTKEVVECIEGIKIKDIIIIPEDTTPPH